MHKEHLLGFLIGMIAKDAVKPAFGLVADFVKRWILKHEAKKVSVKTRIQIASEQLDAALEEME